MEWGKETMTQVTTLVINAPWYRKNAPSFEAILCTGIGPGYAISKKDVNRLPPGSAVVLLRTDKNKARAEGVLIERVETTIPPTKTPQGIQRYDVHVEKWTVVPYKPEKINRFGVAVI